MKLILTVAEIDKSVYQSISDAIDALIQPEKVSLNSDCSGGIEHDMSDIDIRDSDQRINSAKKLMQLVKKNGYENYNIERNHFAKLLAEG